MIRRGFRVVSRGVLAGGAAYGVLVTVDKRRREHFLGICDGLTRFTRTLVYGALAAWDYTTLDWWEYELGRTSDEFRAMKKGTDKRNALRMLYVCKTQGWLAMSATVACCSTGSDTRFAYLQVLSTPSSASTCPL